MENRCIKFRAWYLEDEYIDDDGKEIKSHMEMAYFGLFDTDYGYLKYDEVRKREVGQNVGHENNTTKIMQYTGLKDKNGKEIYEGDILRWTIPKGTGNHDAIELSPEDRIIDEDITTISQVIWEKAAFVLKGVGEYKGWETMLVGTFYRNKYGKIIGNIYENPELTETT